MANAIKVETITTYDDGSTTDVTVSATVVAPEDTEVDVLMSDGTTKKFVPAS